MNRMLDSLLTDLELPSDVVEFAPKISVIANIRVLIENHLGIKSYTDTSIIIKCKKYNIEISGKNLFIKEITKEYVYVFGKIQSIDYTSWE